MKNRLVSYQVFAFLSSSRHARQTLLPLNSETSSSLSQKRQEVEHLVRMILLPSTYISIGSELFISSFFLISFGITILPSSSMFLTMPVDFIMLSFHRVMCRADCLYRRFLCPRNAWQKIFHTVLPLFFDIFILSKKNFYVNRFFYIFKYLIDFKC